MVNGPPREHQPRVRGFVRCTALPQPLHKRSMILNIRLSAILAAALVSVPAVAGAQDHPPSTAAAAFDVFVRDAAATCLSRPSAECVDSGWTFADRDRDQRLTAAEFDGLRQDLGEWFGWRAPSLSNRERNALSFGLLIIDSVGIEQILGGFDSDGDGTVTRAELLTDITLDDRTLGKVLSDPGAVDRAGVARRFGIAAALLPDLVP